MSPHRLPAGGPRHRLLAAVGSGPARPDPPSPAGRAMPLDVALLAEQLAALARAGLPPNRVWTVLAERSRAPGQQALARSVAETVARGTPASRALLAARSREPAGDPELARLAVAVAVSERTGAPLAQTLDRFVDGLRADRQAELERDSALAGPRATTALLSFLPAAGLALGGLLGARPWEVLLATTPGRGCLLGGALFWAAGRAWSGALVRRARIGP